MEGIGLARHCHVADELAFIGADILHCCLARSVTS